MERQDREEAHSKLAELEMKENELMERIALHQQEVWLDRLLCCGLFTLSITFMQL